MYQGLCEIVLDTYKERIIPETEKTHDSIFRYQANLNNAIMSHKN